MIFNNVELHGFDEIRKIPGRPGVLLQRVPESVRCELRDGAQQKYLMAAGGEIRFVSNLEPVKVTLACFGGIGKVSLYLGDFQDAEYYITSEPTVIEIMPSQRFIDGIQVIPKSTFSSSVTRLLLEGDEIHLIDIQGEGIRPPKENELPKLRYLAYGTSITQGLKCTTPMLSYVKQTAWRLGVDSINLGCSGNAFCEKAIADYIAKRSDWNFATICISVNMLNQGVSAKEFREKAEYMIHKIAENNPTKPIVCIGLFPYFLDYGIKNPEQNPVASSEEYRDTLKDVVNSSGFKNVHYVDGRELLKDVHGLTSDLLHPGNLGMIQIGENLANTLRPLIKGIM